MGATTAHVPVRTVDSDHAKYGEPDDGTEKDAEAQTAENHADPEIGMEERRGEERIIHCLADCG